jgi:hypothetical protein
VTFSETYADEKIALLEIPKGLENVFENGETLCFKGDENSGSMVACTSSNTFNVRRVESSNATLLAPRNFSEKTLKVESGASCFYELIPTHPRTKAMWSMLSKYPFDFVDGTERQNRPTYETISRALQASEKEIRSELKRLGAIEFEGKWSIIDETCLDEAFNNLVREMDTNQWSGKEFPRAKWVSSFSSSLSEEEEEDEEEDNKSSSRTRELVANTLYERICESSEENVLSFCKLAKYRASQILREAPQKEWTSEDFFCEWQSRLPDFEGKEPSMSWLEGMILMIPSEERNLDKNKNKDVDVDEMKVDEEDNNERFKMFPLRIHEIASDAGERFDQLFSIRTSWSLDSLRPFMKDFLKSSSEADILVRYTRNFEVDGVRMFAKR